MKLIKLYVFFVLILNIFVQFDRVTRRFFLEIKELFMRRIIFLLTGLFFVLTYKLHAQDTLTFMHYNLLYYGKDTDFCNQTNNEINEKNENLATIINYVKPDIFSVNELDGEGVSPVSDDSKFLLDKALNVSGKDHYRKVPFEEIYLSNTLFYNYKKVRLYSYNPIHIYVGTEKIFNAYTFYYNSESLSTGDTTFFTCFVMHLKAGSGYTLQRKDEAEVFMDYIENEIAEPGNFILLGDLNIYYSNEPGFQTLINPSESVYRFNDPLRLTGNWHNNSEFSDYHTQSTHTYGECFSYGGMDDRFDFILLSDYIINGSHAMEYIPASYRAIGQDGTSFNSSLNTYNNSSVPDSVAEALYDFSDHLPVSLKIGLERNPVSELILNNVFFDPAKPTPKDSVKVYANIIDTEDQLEAVRVKWGTSQGSFSDSSDLCMEGNYYTGLIPPYKNGEDVYFKIFGLNKNEEIILSSEKFHYKVQIVNLIEETGKDFKVEINSMVHDYLNIKTRNFPYNSSVLRVYTLDGKLIFQKELYFYSNHERKIYLNISAGSYVYELRNEGDILKSGIFYKD